MDELTIGDVTYISSKKAAQITGYAKDYVGQLCREGRVAATLVGRNWYVNEEAIREHRFGGNPAASTTAPRAGSEPVIATASWSQPTYKAETPVQIPDLSASIEARRQAELSEEEEETKKALETMQNAWKEWFKNRKEPLLETPEVVDRREAIEEAAQLMEHEEEEQQAAEAIVIKKTGIIEEDPELEELALARSRGDISLLEEVRSEEPVHIYRSVSEPAYVPTPAPAVRQYSAPEAATPREERTILKDRPSAPQKGSLALKALLVGVTGLAIATTLIGTGQFDQFTKKDGVEYTALRFLAGTSIIDKSK